MSPDRYGEPLEDAPEHDPRCRNGWLDRDADPAVPCLICKPHLAPALLRRSTLDADQLRQEPRNPAAQKAAHTNEETK